MKKIKRISYLFTLLFSSIFLFNNVFAVNKVYWSESLGSTQYCTTSENCKTYNDGMTLGELLAAKGIDSYQLYNISKIVFNDILTTNNRITNFTSEVDISRDNDESVIAGIKDNVLYIQYEGTLAFNAISKGLFSKNFEYVEQIEGLQYVDTSEVTDMSSMFAGLIYLTSLDLSSFNTTNVTNMSNMFSKTYSMETLNISSFNTSKVTNMASMFFQTQELKTLNLSNFNTSKVTNMSNMFNGASLLTSLNISSFNTENVTDMSSMFSYVSSLQTLNVSSFDTSKVTDMSYMFNEMRNLTSLNVSNFTTTKVRNMASMFKSLEKITSLNLSSFDTSQVTDMTYMFYKMTNLTSLDISSFNTSSVTSMYGMFIGLSNLPTLNLSHFDTTNVTNMSYMFSGDSAITTLNLSNFITSNVTNMEAMFKGMSNLSSLNISNFVTSNVTSMAHMFNGTSSLSTLSLSHFNTSQVKDMSYMFTGSGITSLSLSNFDTSKVIYINNIFSNMANLTTIDISGFNLSAVNDATNMFYNSSAVTTVNMSNSNLKNYMKDILSNLKGLVSLNLNDITISDTTDMSNLFSNMTNLTTLNIQNFNTSGVTNMESMFENVDKLTSLNLSSFNTADVTNMKNMFKGMSKITSLNLSSFNTSNVTDMEGIFSGMSELTNLNISSFNTSKVTTFKEMFKNLSLITSLDLSHFNTSSATNTEYMFSGDTNLTSINLTSFNTSNVTSMEGMFKDLVNIVSIDLSSFNSSKNTNFNYMFENCPKLVTVYASSNFKYNDIGSGYHMFYGDVSIIGGLGTTYNDSYYDYAMAKVDTLDIPGYFTFKGNITSTTYDIDNENKTITVSGGTIDPTKIETGGLTIDYTPGGDTVGVYYDGELTSTYNVIYELTVIWKNYDGTILETDEKVTKNTMPTYNGTTPSRENTAEYTYEFIGWDKELAPITDDTTYTAVYSETKNKYLITFVDYNDEIISQKEYDYGVLAENIDKPADPTKESTAEYTYSFSGWTPTITNVTREATYKATYNETIRKYTITFVNEDDSVISAKEYDYNTPAANIIIPTNPTKESTAEYTYTFNKWDKTITEVTEDATYKAEYTATKNKYLVTFKNEDDRVISEVEYEYGASADNIVIPDDPTKESTAEYTYTFSGWTPTITDVTGNSTYKATFSSTKNKYLITFVDYNDEIISQKEYDYGVLAENIDKPADPTKESTAEYTYSFSGWTPTITNVTREATYKATYNETIRKYTITFVNEDDSVISAKEYDYGTPAESIIIPTNPTKESTAEYTYTFNKWDKEITTVTTDATYKAEYTATKNKYLVTFKNEDDRVISEVEYEYGASADNIVIPDDPTKESTAEYTYTFSGWTPTITDVTGNATYKATFSSTKNKYLITFVDYNDEIISQKEYDYGVLAENIDKPADPTRSNILEHGYIFAGWTPTITDVTGTATYKATYNETVAKYTITFVNEDDSVISTTEYEYGTSASEIAIPTDPTKESTAEYTYTFNKWDKTITEVTEDATYKAEYTATKNKYLVTFKNEDDRVISEVEYEYGASADNIVIPDDPTKESTAEYTYTFSGWTPTITDVTGNATYKATFSSTKNKYLITFVDYNDEIISQKEYDYGVLAENIDKPADPTRSNILEHGYIFAGWTPTITDVTGTATYKATYNETVAKYTITFVNEDDSVISTTEYEYGTSASEIAIPTDPTKENTAEYTYTFAGWTPTITDVTGTAIYKATFSSTKNKYLITFIGGNNETLSEAEYEYGASADNIVIPDDPTKESTAEYTYTFSGWTPTITDVTGNATYKATFSSTKNKYLITFVDYNDKIISQKEYDYGTLAENIDKPADPTRSSDNQHIYDFTGWNPIITNVTGAATYKATYNETVAKYTITFVNEDDSVISATEYDYGTQAESIIIPADPTKPKTAEYTYTFAGWTPTIEDVTKNATYKATFTSTKNNYKITFIGGNNEILSEKEYEYGTPASSIIRPSNPTKNETAEYTYTFTGWSPMVNLVTSNATYTATFSSTKKKYTITFVNYNNDVISEHEYDYGTLASSIAVPSNPTRTRTDEYTYTFASWTPNITNVTQNATYKAEYTATKNKYTIAFVNENNILISYGEYEYGTPASQIAIPAEPTKESTSEYIYTFSGWYPNEVTTVTENVTYKATFTSTPRVAIQSITTNKSEINLHTSDVYNIIATINPSNVTEDKTLTWRSTKPSVATVDENGRVTALSEGATVIIIQSKNNKYTLVQIIVDNKKESDAKLPGDLNNDSEITLQDVILILRKYLELDTNNYSNADLNNDGEVNLIDVITLIKIYLKIY